MLLNPARELENELNTRRTPRVIDRLRLGTVHACKIRCTNKESLPQAPTTERLQVLNDRDRPEGTAWNRRRAATTHHQHIELKRQPWRELTLEPVGAFRCLPRWKQ